MSPGLRSRALHVEFGPRRAVCPRTARPTLDAGRAAQRAWIVLLPADGVGTNEIVRRVGCSKPTVVSWRRRYRDEGLSEADPTAFGAAVAAGQALREAGRELADVDVAGVYDSFTITLALLLEEIGFSAPGRSGADAAAGRFAIDGDLPLNTHGGLLSYGHCGVAGGLAHLVEVTDQLRGEAGDRATARPPVTGLVHADGGVMSAHVSLVLERP